MPIQAHDANDHTQLVVWAVLIVFGAINVGLAISKVLMWRSWNKFREGQKSSLREFIEMHMHEHEKIDKLIEDIYEKKSLNREDVVAIKQRLEDHMKVCERTVANCQRKWERQEWDGANRRKP
jgi:hypothetical protein